MEPATLSRLNRVARRSTVRLTHYGRKSGKAYEVTIWFMVDGDKVYLGTANVGRQWVRNVKKTPRVRLSIGGEVFDGEARFLTDLAELQHVKALMRRKYWIYRPASAVSRLLESLGLLRDRTGAFEVTLTS